MLQAIPELDCGSDEYGGETDNVGAKDNNHIGHIYIVSNADHKLVGCLEPFNIYVLYLWKLDEAVAEVDYGQSVRSQ